MENDKIITNQSLLASKFDNYFANVFQNLLKGLGEQNNQLQDYLKNPNKHSFFLRETTLGEVAGELKMCDAKKASDLQGMPPKFVKISTDVIKTKMSLIIIESLKNFFQII